jgi:transcriptional accessory protein Tex/SPT6
MIGPPLQVLEYLDVEKYEVPFIWKYRRDYLGTMLTRDHLWQIASLNEKWELLEQAKVREPCLHA